MSGRDKKDSERLKNFILFKFYGTDAERDEAAPFVVVAVVVIVLIFALLSRCHA